MNYAAQRRLSPYHHFVSSRNKRASGSLIWLHVAFFVLIWWPALLGLVFLVLDKLVALG